MSFKSLETLYCEKTGLSQKEVEALFLDNTQSLLKLIEIMGEGDALIWLKKQVSQCPAFLESFFKSFSFLEIAEMTFLKKLFEQNKDSIMQNDDVQSMWTLIFLETALELGLKKANAMSVINPTARSKFYGQLPMDNIKMTEGNLTQEMVKFYHNVQVPPILFDLMGKKNALISLTMMFDCNDYQSFFSVGQFLNALGALPADILNQMKVYFDAQIARPSMTPATLRRWMGILHVISCVYDPYSKIVILRNQLLGSAHFVEDLLQKVPNWVFDITAAGVNNSLFQGADRSYAKDLLEIDDSYPLNIAIYLKQCPEFKSGYDAFLAQFNKINDQNKDEQHRRAPADFFEQYQLVIIQLIKIMGLNAFHWMKKQFATTVLSLERFLKNIPLLQDDAADILKDYFDTHGSEIMSRDGLQKWKNIIILFGASLRISLRSKADFKINSLRELLLSGKNLADLEKAMVNELLVLVGEEAKLTEEERKRVDLEKIIDVTGASLFPSLMTVKDKMQGTDYEAVFQAMLRCYLTEQLWEEYIAREGLDGLREHNENIKTILRQNNINPEKALRYGEKLRFVYEPQGSKVSVLEAQLLALHSYLNSVKEQVEDLQRKDDPFVKSQNKQFRAVLDGIEKIDGQIHKQGASSLLQVLSKNMTQELLKVREGLVSIRQAAVQRAKELPRSFLEFSNHFTDLYQSIDAAKNRAEKSSYAKSSAHNFRVEQWNKNDPRTLFLGDYVGCCLATDGAQVQAIVQRRMDEALLFHVVVDVDTGLPVALLWLYFAMDENEDPVLVVNFPEVAAKYGADEDARKVLFNALLSFTADYCEKNNIKHFYANKPTYGWNTQDFNGLNLKSQPRGWDDKLGGAFVPGVREGDGVTRTLDHYYLKSLQEESFYSVQSASFTPAQKERFMPIEKHMVQVLESNKTMNPDTLLKILVFQFSSFFPAGEKSGEFQILSEIIHRVVGKNIDGLLQLILRPETLGLSQEHLKQFLHNILKELKPVVFLAMLEDISVMKKDDFKSHSAFSLIEILKYKDAIEQESYMIKVLTVCPDILERLGFEKLLLLSFSKDSMQSFLVKVITGSTDIKESFDVLLKQALELRPSSPGLFKEQPISDQFIDGLCALAEKNSEFKDNLMTGLGLSPAQDLKAVLEAYRSQNRPRLCRGG